MPMSNLSKRIFLIWTRAACVLGACGAIGASVLAAEPAAQGVPLDESRMSPEAALRILLGDAAPGLIRPTPALAESFPVPSRADAPLAASARKVVVRPGDTVDGLLRRYLGDSVFSTKFQRQALMRLNPTAFPNGQVHRLEVGAALWIPTDQILMGLLPERKEPVTALATAPSGDPASGQDSAAAARAPVFVPSPTRGWVRFP